MGKHFEGLTELLKHKCIGDDERLGAYKVNDYLPRITREAALFEFPLNGEEMMQKSGKTDPEYAKYLTDYFKISKKHGKHLITPFKITAIEDKHSVVFLENIADNMYTLTMCQSDEKYTEVQGGRLVISRDEKTDMFPTYVEDAMYPVVIAEDKRVLTFTPFMKQMIAGDLVNSAVAYIEQLAYIMDPATFIVQKQGKGKGNSNYLCFDENELNAFLHQNPANEYSYPMKGFWNAKENEVIGQAFKGKSNLVKDDFNYQVLIKKDPATLTVPECIEAREKKA